MELNKELNTINKIIIFTITIPLTTFYVFYIILNVIVYTTFKIIYIISYRLTLRLKIKKKIKIIKYKNTYLKSNNIYIVFIKSVFFDYILKNGFFYSYSIIKFFKKKLYKEIELKRSVDILTALIIRIIFILLTGITILILKTNLNLNKIINDILQYKADSNTAYLHNILNNIIYKINFDLNENLKGRRILILKNKIRLNMKQGGSKMANKTLNYVSDKASRKLNKFNKQTFKENKEIKPIEIEIKKEKINYNKELLIKNENYIRNIHETKTNLTELKIKNKTVFTNKENIEKYNQITKSISKEANIIVCKITHLEPKAHITGSYNATIKKDIAATWEDFKNSETNLRVEESFRNIKINKEIKIKTKVLINETKSKYVKAVPESMETNYKSKGSFNSELITHKTKPIIARPEDIWISENSLRITSNIETKNKMMLETTNSLIIDYNNNTEYYIGGGNTLIKGKLGFKDLVDKKLEKSDLTIKIKEGGEMLDTIKKESSLHDLTTVDMETQKEITVQIVFTIDGSKKLEIIKEKLQNKKEINKNITSIYENLLNKK